MIYCPKNYKKKFQDINQYAYNLQGELDDAEARELVVKMLRANIEFTFFILTGIRLYPFQVMMLKAMLNRNFTMNVLSRGGGKSTIAAYFCILQCIFEPNTKIIIAGPQFRTARNIFNEIVKLVERPGAELLAQCLGKGAVSRRPDICEMIIGSSSIKAIPLNGEKIRGFRANVLILDEFLLLSKEMIEKVLMPFLISPRNLEERTAVRALEDELIASGKMRESDRQVFNNAAKMIALSSASFTHEYLYEVFKNWSSKIKLSDAEKVAEGDIDEEFLRQAQEEKEMAEKLGGKPTYSIFQIGIEALPEDMADKAILEDAKSRGFTDPMFLREYGAQFVDGSESYFNVVRMNECTVKPGESPCVELVGDPSASYLLSIDPSSSDKLSSDYFAISVFRINHENKIPTLVHCYAMAGGETQNHHAYLFYLLKNFNIELIIIDNAGGIPFITGAVESQLFKENNLNLEFLDFDSNASDVDYFNLCNKTKNEINKTTGKIVISQVFSSDWLRKSNEFLKNAIDYKKVRFASGINENDYELNRYINMATKGETPFMKAAPHQRLIKDDKVSDDVTEFIDFQDEWIFQTKKQISLIDVVLDNVTGHQSFGLPTHLKRSQGKDKIRKDNYTTFLLGVWLNKIYFDINKNFERKTAFFTPRFLKRG